MNRCKGVEKTNVLKSKESSMKEGDSMISMNVKYKQELESKLYIVMIRKL